MSSTTTTTPASSSSTSTLSTTAATTTTTAPVYGSPDGDLYHNCYREFVTSMGVASARTAYLDHVTLLRAAVIKPRWQDALQTLSDYTLPSLLPNLESVADRFV